MNGTPPKATHRVSGKYLETRCAQRVSGRLMRRSPNRSPPQVATYRPFASDGVSGKYLETRSRPSAAQEYRTGVTLGDLTGDARLAIRERRTKYDPLTGGQCVFLRLLSGVNGVGEGEWIADRVPMEDASSGESAMLPLLVEDEASTTTSVLAASVRGMAVVERGASPPDAPRRPLSPRGASGGVPTPFSPGKDRQGGGGERVPLELCATSSLPPGLRVTHYVLLELQKRSMVLSDVLCEPRAEAPHDTARANIITDRVRIVSALEAAGVHVTRQESELLHATLEQRVQELRAQAGGDGRLRDARVDLLALSESIIALDPSSTLLPMAPTSAARQVGTLCDELGDARAVQILSPPHIEAAVAAAAETSFDRSDGELSCMYRYISHESCSQFDSLPLTSLTVRWIRWAPPLAETDAARHTIDARDRRHAHATRREAALPSTRLGRRRADPRERDLGVRGAHRRAPAGGARGERARERARARRRRGARHERPCQRGRRFERRVERTRRAIRRAARAGAPPQGAGRAARLVQPAPRRGGGGAAARGHERGALKSRRGSCDGLDRRRHRCDDASQSAPRRESEPAPGGGAARRCGRGRRRSGGARAAASLHRRGTRRAAAHCTAPL